MNDEEGKHRDFYLEHEINLVILRLIQLRDSKKSRIKSVASSGGELTKIKQRQSIDLKKLTRKDAEDLCIKSGYVSPKRGAKCDVIINGIRTAIRCLNYTDRPLVNHTTRPKYEKVCRHLGISIDFLDDAVAKYIFRRRLGIFNEDCYYYSEANPFIPYKNDLKKVLTHLAFNSFNYNKDIGSENFVSDHIDNILDFIDPVAESTWRIYTQDNYFDSIWTALCFSLRDKKGMPDDDKLYLPENRDVLKWNYQFVDDEGNIRNKAALHIRVKKYDSKKHGSPLEIRYQNEIKTIKANKGEQDEYLLKLFLIDCRQKALPIPLGEDIQIVKSVGTKTLEYGILSYNLDWSSLKAEELISVCASVKATKAGMFDKSDVYINGIGISIKSQRGGNPSLINHTTREKILRVMNACKRPMLPIDQMVDNYWALRLSKQINEDISISEELCPFGTRKDSEKLSILKPLLNYFAFDGTGTRDSSSPATLILSIESPTDVKTWHYFSKDNFVDSIWDRLVFSIREKSTPQIINDELTEHNQMLPWIREVDHSLKGALSVRISSRKKQ